MKYIWLMVAMAGLLMAQPASAAVSTGGLMKLAKSDDPQNLSLAKLYFSALYDGELWVTIDAQADGHPVFCPPSKVALVPEQLIAITEKFLSENSADYKLQGVTLDDEEPGMVLLMALKATFPCEIK